MGTMGAISEVVGAGDGLLPGALCNKFAVAPTARLMPMITSTLAAILLDAVRRAAVADGFWRYFIVAGSCRIRPRAWCFLWSHPDQTALRIESGYVEWFHVKHIDGGG